MREAVLLTWLMLLLAKLSTAQSSDLSMKLSTYIIVFDAGSTGTRAFVYDLQFDPHTPARYRFLFTFSQKLKGGLSSFANQPQLAGDRIQQLLNKVEVFIPWQQRRCTFAIVRATAGLRLIDSFKRRRILKSVTDALTHSQYRTPEQNAVKVITGNQEAKFAWGAINFMINRLDGPFVPVLEMGGGSLQIAYKADGDVKDTATFRVKSNIKLHTHSYLGLGASQAFLDHLGFKGDARTYETPCVAAGKQFTFVFGRHSVKVLGTAIDSDKRGEECLRRAREVVMNKVIHNELYLYKIYCMGAVYYQLKRIYKQKYVPIEKQACCFDPDCKSYSIMLSDLRKAVLHECANPAESGKYSPYYCFQMAVFYSFMSDGLRVDWPMEIIGLSSKKAGWTLGAAFEFLKESESLPKVKDAFGHLC